MKYKPPPRIDKGLCLSFFLIEAVKTDEPCMLIPPVHSAQSPASSLVIASPHVRTYAVCSLFLLSSCVAT